MRKAGYSERFASALITAEGAIDNLIPPSIGMIIFGIASDTSIIALFAAGIVPGLLLAGLFAIYIYWHSAQLGLRETERFSLAEFLAAT
jgi:C4-dicarboxylate transporter DctM subunit